MIKTILIRMIKEKRKQSKQEIYNTFDIKVIKGEK